MILKICNKFDAYALCVKHTFYKAMIFDGPFKSEHQFATHPKPAAQDVTLDFYQFACSGMSYRFVLKESPRGCFLRISAKFGEMFYGITVLESGLDELAARLRQMSGFFSQPPQNAAGEEWHIGPKQYTMTLEGDLYGKYIRIVEKIGVYTNELIVVAAGLEEFVLVVEKMAQTGKARALGVPVGASMMMPLEEILQAGEMVIDRKIFTFQLAKNAKGQFLRITENSNNRRNSIIIPADRLGEFKNLAVQMAAALSEIKANEKQEIAY